jgi:hypothetical protein
MFAMMTGTRRAVMLPASSNLGAFAASDDSSAGVVVFNYNSTFTEAPEAFSVELNHLPFDGAVTVSRYLIDARYEQSPGLSAAERAPGSQPANGRAVQRGCLEWPACSAIAQSRAGRDLLAGLALDPSATCWRWGFGGNPIVPEHNVCGAAIGECLPWLRCGRKWRPERNL